MKSLLYFIIVFCFIISCSTSKKIADKNNSSTETVVENDTVKIANEELEYEIIIFEPGFNVWLNSTAKPEGYYSQSFLESRNAIYVAEWNYRVSQPSRFSPNLYELPVDYSTNIDYGYEVNYKLYNYFVYFQLKYKQRLAGFLPRI